MQLESRVYYKSSAVMSELDDESVNLIITSPPYPMVGMWDEIFSGMHQGIGESLNAEDGPAAYELMHVFLDLIWKECIRVLTPGGFLCINIGDATRKVGDDFRLYPNHSRITESMMRFGLSALPMIHWFKPTNAPNKFMGSGMLPSGAYVTLEHEYILLFRKGSRRSYNAAEKEIRRKSAFFWEERNIRFSDVWNCKGEKQLIDSETAARNRSGAFPFEIPHRLINMYSMQGDTILDPFIGTGTSLAASVVNGRRCIGYDTDEGLKSIITRQAETAAENAENIHRLRLVRHRNCISARTKDKGQPKYMNKSYGFPVVTRQECDLCLPELQSFEAGNFFSAVYL